MLLDEVGTGTDPAEGGALATAIIAHFKERGALVLATTHYDALKTWGTATDGVTTAAFAFDPQTFAPSYRLVYGAPGRSLAIEISQRLGLPTAGHRRRAQLPQRRSQAARRAPRTRRRPGAGPRQRAAEGRAGAAGAGQREPGAAPARERRGRARRPAGQAALNESWTIGCARPARTSTTSSPSSRSAPTPSSSRLRPRPSRRDLDRRCRAPRAEAAAAMGRIVDGLRQPGRRRPRAGVLAAVDRRRPGPVAGLASRGSSSRWTAPAPSSTSAASVCAPRPAICV